MSAEKANKTCVHCDKVLPERIDALDLFGGLCGLCEGCRSWQRAHYAEVEKRILAESKANTAEIEATLAHLKADQKDL